MPDPSLNEKLQEYYKAVEEEFRVTPREFDEAKREEFADKAKAKLLELVPQAISTIEYLMVHGEKESVKAGLAKYVLDSTLSPNGLGTPVDPLEALANRLRDAAAATSTPSD